MNVVYGLMIPLGWLLVVVHVGSLFVFVPSFFLYFLIKNDEIVNTKKVDKLKRWMLISGGLFFSGFVLGLISLILASSEKFFIIPVFISISMIFFCLWIGDYIICSYTKKTHNQIDCKWQKICNKLIVILFGLFCLSLDFAAQMVVFVMGISV